MISGASANDGIDERSLRAELGSKCSLSGFRNNGNPTYFLRATGGELTLRTDYLVMPISECFAFSIGGNGPAVTPKSRWILKLSVACVTLFLATTLAQRITPQPELRRLATPVSPGWFDWIYDPGVPSEARARLEPLYQRLDYLERICWSIATIQTEDRVWDLLAATEAAIDSKAAPLVEKSATGKVRPENAATSADSPEALGWDIGNEVHDLESQIKAVRHDYHLDTTIGRAPKPFELSSIFNDQGLKHWLSTTDDGQKLLDSATGIVLKAKRQKNNLDQTIASTAYCFPEKQHCIASCPPNTSSPCPDECTLAYVICQGQTPEPKLVLSIARAKAAIKCTENWNKCHTNCSMDNLQAWNQCLDRCNNAGAACKAAASSP